MFGVADYESALVDHYEVRGGNTICTQKHAKRFVTELRQLARKIHERFPSCGLPAKRTREEEESYDKETKCFACGGEFLPFDKKLQKVFDHDHYTGAYRSAMHNASNRQCKDTRTFPIFFHTFLGYDAHFLVRELNTIDDGEISALPRNEEKFISVQKSFHTANGMDYQGNPCKKYVHFEFKDSYSFMNGSLDTMSKNLKENDFDPLCEAYGETWKLLTGKQVFPYRFLRNLESMKHEGLVPKEWFGSRQRRGV